MRPLRLALISLLLGGAAHGTLFQTLTLAQQAKKADVIVQATIGTPTTATEGGQTYAVYPLKVSETLAGDAATLPQTVGSQDGNGPALYVLSGVDSAPTFQAGQEAVLLLYKGRLDSPLVGYNQGAYLISGGLVSPLVSPLAAAGTTSAPQGSGGSFVPGQAPAQATSQAPALSTAGQPVLGQTAIPTTPTASTVPGTASDASAATSNQAATRAATLNPATAAPGISTTVAGTAVPTGSLPATAPLAATTTAPVTTGSAATGTVGTTTSGTAPSGTSTAANTATGTTAATGSGTGTGSPATSTTPSAAASQPVAVTNGVLGTIRTPAELKAAIVAARAAK